MTGRPADFIVRSEEPINGGPAPRVMTASFITPTELFFIRNHGQVPAVDVATYRLEVGGLVARPLTLSLDELAQRFERVEVTSTLACAGQRRQELSNVAPIPGELPWGSEAVSTAVWSGWRLGDVLRACGLEPAALHVAFEGLDEVERRSQRFKYGASIPTDKALAPEVLLADTMNGLPLPPEHGYPLRLVVPGFIGARQVKWLRSITARAAPSDNYFQAVAYRRYPREMVAATHDPARGIELTELEVNCLIAEPVEDAALASGPVRVRGVAYSGGGGRVARVEVTCDGGATWLEADLEPATPGVDTRWTWRIFECHVDPVAVDGVYEIVARAVDDHGATQPMNVDGLWNFKGYMNNAWARVRVRLTPGG